MRIFFIILLNIIFNYLLNIIKIKIIFWQLVKNLTESSLKLIFKSASQLLNWAIMLLYVSLNIFNELILMLLWLMRSTEQSELLSLLTEIIKIFLRVLSLKALSHSNNYKKFLCFFISHWNLTWSAVRIVSVIK